MTREPFAVMSTRYDFEKWQNIVLDGLKEHYHLSEIQAINVLEHQKLLVNQLFDDFVNGKDQSFSLLLESLMENDTENDCWN